MQPTPPRTEPASTRGSACARRDFMGLALCAPAAAAGSLLGLATPPAVAAVPAPPSAAAVQRGYQRSAHIDTYYASLQY